MICRQPGEPGYNPDGSFPTALAPIRAKAALVLVERMVANQAAAPAAINVLVMLPEKRPVSSIPADKIKVIEGGGN